jgi:pimeloyl-ACP methyl ester carboxylesterase
MTTIRANGIDLDYADYADSTETGDSDAPALVLIRGLGTQRIQWPDELIDGLVERGLRVLCHDNRDIGLSQYFSEAGVPDIAGALAKLARGESVDAAYSLADMAEDVIGLLDALEIERAHVAGISMGGMIVQHLAASHGERLLSATSIMSSSGGPGLPAATPEAMQALMSSPDKPGDRESVIEHGVRTRKIIASPGYPTDDDTMREAIARTYDRSYRPDGVARQMLAVLCDTGRSEMLAGISVPTLVIHGEDDPLVPIECGRDTAARIPGAHFEPIPGMGHDIPVGLASALVELIADHAKRAEPG